MSNVGFDLEVFNKVAAAVAPPGGSANKPFAALGAIGPDLYQYIPISSALSDALDGVVKQAIQSLTPAQINALTPPPVDFTPIQSNPALASEAFEKPLMAAYSIVFREMVVPFWPIFQRDTALLNQLQTAANNQDSNALQSLASSTNQLTTDGAQLKQLTPTLLGVLSALTAVVALPPAIETVGTGAKPWLPQGNRPFEFLRWHLTDKFAQQLVSTASTDGQKAYAYGHLCHVAASVTAKPFINNIVGGPYRTHWWRNRWVSNYVDAWTYGRYQTPATMGGPNGDTPTPAYSSWSSIRTANLQEQFNVAGFTTPANALPDALNAVATGQLGTLPGAFPADLATYVNQAVQNAYPAMLIPAGLTMDAVSEAFAGLYAVVWFMTSGFGPMTPFDLGSAPSSCTTAPGWVTSGGSPPSPQQSGPSTAATVCGVVLAILALVLFIFQQWALGAAAVAGAIAAFASGGGIDWDQLACNLYWLRKSLLDGGNAIVDALVKSGLAYPAPAQLGIGSGDQPAVDNGPNGGMPLTKSNPSGSLWAPAMAFPHQLDTSVSGFADLDFGKFPTSDPETPQTMNFPLDPGYADQVVDGAGLQNGGMLNGNTFPSANLFFGDALSNAQQLIAAQASKLPSYNLDADRGYGWLTWGPPVNTFPGNGTVNNPIKE